jgi:hypothetical protein
MQRDRTVEIERQLERSANNPITTAYSLDDKITQSFRGCSVTGFTIGKLLSCARDFLVWLPAINVAGQCLLPVTLFDEVQSIHSSRSRLEGCVAKSSRKLTFRLTFAKGQKRCFGCAPVTSGLHKPTRPSNFSLISPRLRAWLTPDSLN